MASFDPSKYQVSPNGALSKDTINRIVAIKERSGMAYAALGKKLGISGTFLHNLVNKHANVGTQHVERIVNAIEFLEHPEKGGVTASVEHPTLEHSFHLRPGLKVSIALPQDLTPREAERLAQFVQSLPVA